MKKLFKRIALWAHMEIDNLKYVYVITFKDFNMQIAERGDYPMTEIVIQRRERRRFINKESVCDSFDGVFYVLYLNSDTKTLRIRPRKGSYVFGTGNPIPFITNEGGGAVLVDTGHFSGACTVHIPSAIAKKNYVVMRNVVFSEVNSIHRVRTNTEIVESYMEADISRTKASNNSIAIDDKARRAQHERNIKQTT